MAVGRATTATVHHSIPWTNASHVGYVSLSFPSKKKLLSLSTAEYTYVYVAKRDTPVPPSPVQRYPSASARVRPPIRWQTYRHTFFLLPPIRDHTGTCFCTYIRTLAPTSIGSSHASNYHIRVYVVLTIKYSLSMQKKIHRIKIFGSYSKKNISNM